LRRLELRTPGRHQPGAIVSERLHNDHEQECFGTVVDGALLYCVCCGLHLVLPAVRPSSPQIQHKRQMACGLACDNPRPPSVTFGLLVVACTISDTERQPSCSKDVEGCASWHYKDCFAGCSAYGAGFKADSSNSVSQGAAL